MYLNFSSTFQLYRDFEQYREPTHCGFSVCVCVCVLPGGASTICVIALQQIQTLPG